MRSSPRSGSCSRRCAAGGRSAGFPWGELGVALHDFDAGARARELRRRRRSSRSSSSASTSLLLDGVLALRARQRGRGAPATPGCGPSRRCSPASSSSSCSRTSLRYEPTVTGHIQFALLQGNDQDRNLTQQEIDVRLPDQQAPRARRDAAGPLRPDRVPRVRARERPDHRSRAAVPARRGRRAQHGAVVLANARVVPDADGGLATTRTSRTARRQVPGRLREAAPRARSVSTCRGGASCSFISELQQIPYDYERGQGRGASSGTAGHPFGTVICFESAFSPLVRDYVRDGARAHRRQHEQPVVPAVRARRAAPRAEPDARRGDRPAGAARVDLGDHRRHRPGRRTCTTRASCS